jgi:hypothetical protein
MLFKNIRHDAGYEHEDGHDFGELRRSPEEGVYTIIKYELGYGGRVTALSDEGMTVRTRVMSKIDTVYVKFETPEEKDMMACALYHWYKASDEVMKDDTMLSKAFELTGGNPFLVANGLPLVLNQEKVKRTLLLALGLADKPEIVVRLKTLRDEDIVAVSELLREGASWEDAIDAL